MNEPTDLKLSNAMRGALGNLLAGRPWNRGLNWRERTRQNGVAMSVAGGLTATLPALRRRGLIDSSNRLTLKGRQVANALKAAGET